MVINESDSDILQWGLRLLDVDPYSNAGYYGETIHNDVDDNYPRHYVGSNYETDSNDVENDEIIARTLQEEFSRIAVTETSGYSDAGEEHSQASNLVHNWHSPSTKDYYPGIRKVYCQTSLLDVVTNLCVTVLYIDISYIFMFFFLCCVEHDYTQGEFDYVLPSSSCSSSSGQEEHLHSLEPADEYAHDDEVCWKLNQMTPIPVSTSTVYYMISMGPTFVFPFKIYAANLIFTLAFVFPVLRILQ